MPTVLQCYLELFTFPFNYSGNAAISVPVGKTKAGLPVGLQVVVRNTYDSPQGKIIGLLFLSLLDVSLILQMAHAFEKAELYTDIDRPSFSKLKYPAGNCYSSIHILKDAVTSVCIVILPKELFLNKSMVCFPSHQKLYELSEEDSASLSLSVLSSVCPFSSLSVFWSEDVRPFVSSLFFESSMFGDSSSFFFREVSANLFNFPLNGRVITNERPMHAVHNHASWST